MVLGDAVKKLQAFVSVTISLNLKRAPVPYTTPKWPIACLRECTSSVIISWQILV